MRGSRASGAARVSNYAAALDVLARFHSKARQVSVMSRNTAAVLDDDHVPISVIPARELDGPGQACPDRLAPMRFDVAAAMKLLAPGERVPPVPEAASDLRVSRNSIVRNSIS